MSPQAQQTAMEELAGYQFRNGKRVPRFLEDPNDTHAVLMSLPEEQRKAVRYYLNSICGQMFAHCATAAQYTEAILKAIGKWEDSK